MARASMSYSSSGRDRQTAMHIAHVELHHLVGDSTDRIHSISSCDFQQEFGGVDPTLTVVRLPACAADRLPSDRHLCCQSTSVLPSAIMMKASCHHAQLEPAHACQQCRVVQLCMHGAHSSEQLVSRARRRAYTRAFTRQSNPSSRTQRFTQCTASSAAQIQTAGDGQPALPALQTHSWQWRSHKIKYAVRSEPCRS